MEKTEGLSLGYAWCHKKFGIPENSAPLVKYLRKEEWTPFQFLLGYMLHSKYTSTKNFCFLCGKRESTAELAVLRTSHFKADHGGCGRRIQGDHVLYRSRSPSATTSSIWYSMMMVISHCGWEGILLKKPATYFCSCPCSRHLVISSSSASMGLVLLKTNWRRGSVPRHSPSLNTTWDALTLLSSTAWHCRSLPDNTPCPRPCELSQLTEDCCHPSAIGLTWSCRWSMNSTLTNLWCSTSYSARWTTSSPDVTTTSKCMLHSCSLATFHPALKMICIIFYSSHRPQRRTLTTQRWACLCIPMHFVPVHDMC